MAGIGNPAVVSLQLSEKLEKSYFYSNHLIENYKKTLLGLYQNVKKKLSHTLIGIRYAEILILKTLKL